MPHSAEQPLVILCRQRDQLDHLLERADEIENPIERTNRRDALMDERDFIISAIMTATQESYAPGNSETT
jgi:hypothetical protein